VDFHGRCVNMYMILNGTEHMYTITIGLHMMVYVVSCLDVHVCLCFPKSRGVHGIYIYIYIYIFITK
jgi:hypothetical protein